MAVKYTERQKEAIAKLKAYDSQLKSLQKISPNPEDYDSKEDYSIAVNAANKKYWSETLGAQEGKTIGQIAQEIRQKRKELIKTMSTKRLKSGYNPTLSGLTPLTKQEKISPNIIHLGIGNAKFRRKYPLLKINKKSGTMEAWDNPFYVRKYDEAVMKKDAKVYEQVRQDYMREADTSGLSSDQIEAGINEMLPNWHHLKKGGINYEAPKVNEAEKDKQASINTINNKRTKSNYGDDKYAGLTIAGKAVSPIQRKLLDAGHTVKGLELLIEKNRDWQDARR